MSDLDTNTSEAIISAANGVRHLREGVEVIEKLTADVRTLVVSPGDTVVLSFPEQTPRGVVEQGHDLIAGKFDNPTIVLCGGVGIGVLRPSGEAVSPSA